ncbi:MAG: HD domain-containing protein [Rhodospirillales bacterium]
MTAFIDHLEELFATKGEATYGERVTQRDHALQTAACARAEDAEDSLVIAALLHDVGHLVTAPDDAFGQWNHGESGADFLAAHFDPAVCEPVRLHVQAKRYLCQAEPGYHAKLSPASTHTLAKQGGPFTAEEARAFLARPHAQDAIRLRRWDESGKVDGLDILPFAAYRARLERLCR